MWFSAGASGDGDQAAMTWASSAGSSNAMQVLMQASLALTTEPSLERVLQKMMVALMDIQIPGVNGVEALRTIRTVAPRLTVIMMTAFTSHELVGEARRASAVGVFFKPRVLDLISSSARPGGAQGALA